MRFKSQSNQMIFLTTGYREEDEEGAGGEIFSSAARFCYVIIARLLQR